MYTENDIVMAFDVICKRKSIGFTPKDQFWFVLLEFAVAMTEGDLNDYAFNATGRHFFDLKDALIALKARDVLEIIEAMTELLDGHVPVDIQERQSVLSLLNDESLEILDALTEDYYDVEESYWQLLLTAYNKG